MTNRGLAKKLRIAIIGCGPRGLQCLEAISRHLSGEQLRMVSVTVFEPADVLGAGRVYDPGQSQALRMNFATQYIDFWKASADHKTAQSSALLGWLSSRYPELAETDQYIPRAIVGEYLRDCYEDVRSGYEDVGGLTVERSLVQGIAWKEPEFTVTTESGSFPFDRVVVTTGHEGLRGSPILPTDGAVVPALPTEPYLSRSSVPPGSRVLVRGFGLTAIDAIISLTEARGGRFIEDRFLPRYVTSHAEPLRIDVRSRSGRPMLAKPTAKVEPIQDSFWDPFRARLKVLMAEHGGLNFQRDIWPVITDAAASVLIHSGTESTRRDVEGWFRGWSQCEMDGDAAKRAMIQSYAAATGRRPIDIPFALGDAWRRLYPDWVRLVSHGGLTPASWKSFAITAREMERIAFGPPAQSVARLLRLVRVGLVTIGIEGDEKQDEQEPGYDVVVNAVIAGPHEHDQHGPLRSLIEEGRVEVDPVSGGVTVDANGHAYGTTSGLAIFGRATEGWIVGNDTLSRTLHDHIENWARSLQSTIQANIENELSGITTTSRLNSRCETHVSQRS